MSQPGNSLQRCSRRSGCSWPGAPSRRTRRHHASTVRSRRRASTGGPDGRPGGAPGGASRQRAQLAHGGRHRSGREGGHHPQPDARGASVHAPREGARPAPGPDSGRPHGPGAGGPPRPGEGGGMVLPHPGLQAAASTFAAAEMMLVPAVAVVAVLAVAAPLTDAQQAFSEGRYDAAEKLALEAARPPQAGAALYLAGLARFRAGRPAEALEAFDAAGRAEDAPDRAQWSFNRGACSMRWSASTRPRRPFSRPPRMRPSLPSPG